MAAVPLWAAFFDAMIPGGTTVFTWRVGVGLALGFFGSALLAGVTPTDLLGADLEGPVALTLASACWALGSVYSKRRPTESSPYAASAVQMLVGGAAITLLGLLGGEAADWHTHRRGLGALAYLVVFGSIVGFTAYAYALRHASATVVGTYAYVNPVVAVLLGWLVLGEAITGRTIAAMVLILGAVLMIQLAPKRGTVAGGQGTAAGAEDRVTATAPTLDRPFAGDDELEELVSGFEDGTLPKPRWTHRAHLAVGPGLLRPHAGAGGPGAAPRADPPLQRGERRGEHEHRRVSRDDHPVLHLHRAALHRGGSGGGHPGGAGQPALPAVWRPQSAQTLLQRGPALLGGSPGPVDRSRPAAARLSGRAVTTARAAAAAAS